ncbi:dienelactone hydrolase family protein [Endozoicomonas sp. Mp262]|uniref:dienelactone hydrolase family protein n=1 Tax=Endozoicomonas sp. Mp262 TaxID=2919499 RepID=UPI0021DB0C33
MTLLVVGLWPYRSAIFVKNRSWENLNDIVTPFIAIKTPEGTGPFPVVLVFPGCEGVKPERAKPRMDWLVNAGYMAVMVDSHSGRGLNEDAVCSGYALWGSERAGDLYIALNFIKHHPLANTNKVAILGYSHGGWTILDALSYNGKLPRGLDSAPEDLFSMIKAAVVYYPYCGYPSRARYSFSSPIPLLAIHAGQDSTVDPEACTHLMTSWQNQGLPITSITYPNIKHCFDIAGHKNFDPKAHDKVLSALAEFLTNTLNKT